MVCKSFLDLVLAVNSSKTTPRDDVVFFTSHSGVVLGKTTLGNAETLAASPIFQFDARRRTLQLVQMDSVSKRSEAIDALFVEYRNKKTFSALDGWRDELYAVYEEHGELYFCIERAAACIIGLVTYGTHITGYVSNCDPNKYLIWVPRRAATKQTWPNYLDNTVAGGIECTQEPIECCIKECYEEAGLPKEYVEQQIRPTGAIIYEYHDQELNVYQPEVEYTYDLLMEPGVVPKPVDGEVASFELLSVPQVKERLFCGEFKYNSAAVLVDFFMRHGIITPESEPQYLEILLQLHRRLEYPLRRRAHETSSRT